MKLSSYKHSDMNEIQSLFTKAFSDSEGQVEGVLVGNLALDMMQSTESKDIFGFVATEQDQIIGCIFFTRLSFPAPVKAFILAPVAVLTSYQGQGVGQQLIKYGIEQLEQEGVELLFTYGDPNFYSKVGFQSITEAVAKAPLKLTQPEGWLCQALGDGEIKPIPGNSNCVTALNKPELW